MLRTDDETALTLEAAAEALVGAAAAPPPAAASTKAVSDQLGDLAALHRDGLLSDAEFASAKSKLLDS